MSTLGVAVSVVVQVPMLPPFTVCPLVHGAAAVGWGLGVVDVGAGVYT